MTGWQYGWLVRASAFVGVIWFVFVGFGLRRAERVYGLLVGYATQRATRAVYTAHVFAAVTATAFGFSLASWAPFFYAAIPGVALGCPVGLVWARWRMGRGTSVGASRFSVEGADLRGSGSPQDAAADPDVQMHDIEIKPLPLRADLLIIVGCECIGLLMGVLCVRLRLLGC